MTTKKTRGTWNEEMLLLAFLGVLAALALLVSVGCGAGGDVTGPSPSGTGTYEGGSASASTPPAPAASPTPAPQGPAPYADFNKVSKDGSGQLCNPTGHPVEAKVEYFDATNFQQQKLLTVKEFLLEAGKCAPVPPASEVLVDLACGQELKLQLDASTKSAHIGHVFVDLRTRACGCEDYTRPGPTKFGGKLVFTPAEKTVEVQVEGASPEGSTFFPTLPAIVARPAFGAPAGTFSTTQTFVGTYGPEGLGCSYSDSRVLEIGIPPQECKEDPKESSSVTYGEWGETKEGEGGCYQERTVTTTIKTDFVCKEDTEEVKVTTETRKVECPCVEEWEEQEPIVTYTEWGECQSGATYSFEGCVPEKCYQTRTKLIVVNEKNSCTQQVREKYTKKETESKECACPRVEVCANTDATSSAAQGFELPNSGDETELAWVNENVQIGPFKLLDKDDARWGWGSCTLVDISIGSTAKVALVKAGTTYQYYLNVKDGQTICSWAGPKGRKNISHVSYFGCK